jgi:hypothetical protein
VPAAVAVEPPRQTNWLLLGLGALGLVVVAGGAGLFLALRGRGRGG